MKEAEVESIIDKYLETLKSDNEDVRSFMHSDLLASFHICFAPGSQTHVEYLWVCKEEQDDQLHNFNIIFVDATLQAPHTYCPMLQVTSKITTNTEPCTSDPVCLTLMISLTI